MAAALEKQADAAVELRPGARGAFEVSIDGALVFSKKALDRFPDAQEILVHLR